MWSYDISVSLSSLCAKTVLQHTVPEGDLGIFINNNYINSSYYALLSDLRWLSHSLLNHKNALSCLILLDIF